MTIMILIVLGIILYVGFTVWAMSKGLANKFPMDKYDYLRRIAKSSQKSAVKHQKTRK